MNVFPRIKSGDGNVKPGIVMTVMTAVTIPNGFGVMVRKCSGGKKGLNQ